MLKRFIFLIFIIQTPAMAAFYLEPYAGVNFLSKWQEDGSTSKEDLKGHMFGARFGAEKMGFMIGLDGRKANWSADISPKEDLVLTTYSLFAGYEFPVLLRVWAQYVIGGYADVDDGGEYRSADGMILGFGYKVLPYVSLNFETGNIRFKEFEDDNGSNISRKDEGTFYLFSISFPFTIGI